MLPGSLSKTSGQRRGQLSLRQEGGRAEGLWCPGLAGCPHGSHLRPGRADWSGMMVEQQEPWNPAEDHPRGRRSPPGALAGPFGQPIPVPLGPVAPKGPRGRSSGLPQVSRGRDSAAIAEAVDRALSDPILRREPRAAGLQVAARYPIEAAVERLEGVLLG